MRNDNVMTTRELAEYIKLNEKTVIKMAQSGKIPGSCPQSYRRSR